MNFIYSGIRCLKNCSARTQCFSFLQLINYSQTPSQPISQTSKSINDDVKKNIDKVEITPNLIYFPANNNIYEPEKKPLVLIYAWLVAKAKHIYNYGELYSDKGFDVLHIKIQPNELLWPKNAVKTIENIAEFVYNRPIIQPIIVHGFSVGGYLYGETINKFINDNGKSDMSRRIRGQIFDSPVDLEGVPRGVGMALTHNKAFQKSIKLSLDSYLYLFDNQVTKYYRRSSEMFHKNPLKTPSLMFYSLSDPIGIPGPIEKAINSWKSQGIPVTSKCWEKSRHVSHYKTHEEEYKTYLFNFIDSLNLK